MSFPRRPALRPLLASLAVSVAAPAARATPPPALALPAMFRDMNLRGAPCREAGPEYLAMAMRGTRPRSAGPADPRLEPMIAPAGLAHARRFQAAELCLKNFSKALRYTVPDTGDPALVKAVDLLTRRGGVGPLLAAFQVYSGTTPGAAAPAPAEPRSSATPGDTAVAGEVSFAGQVLSVRADGDGSRGTVVVESDRAGPAGPTKYAVDVTGDTVITKGFYDLKLLVGSLSPGDRVFVRAIDHGLEGAWVIQVEGLSISLDG